MIEYMHKKHLSIIETTIKFNLANHSIVVKRKRIYYEKGSQALYKEQRDISKNKSSKPPKKKLSKENEADLIEEVQRLIMENAY